MKALHLISDMDFSRKLDTYTIPRRRAGDQVHMNFPAPATIAADKPIQIKGRSHRVLRRDRHRHHRRPADVPESRVRHA